MLISVKTVNCRNTAGVKMGNKDEVRKFSWARQGKEPHFFREGIGNETMSFPRRGRGNTGGCTADKSISLTCISHSTGF